MVSSSRLVGRERESMVFHELISTADGSGAALLVLGEPGIGKTSLLAQARRVARDAGVRVTSAAGVESEAHLPFGGLHQLLASWMHGAGELRPTERAALRTAFGLSEGPRPDLFLIAEAAASLLESERSQGPVMLLADDVQWLDPQSHQILTFLGHRAGKLGLLVIGAARTGHDGPFIEAGFPELLVKGVDDAAAEEILRTSARELNATARTRVFQEAKGNPLALLELPVTWGDGPSTDQHPPTLSERLEQAFAGRISALPEVTRDGLLVAATDSSSDLEEIVEATAVLRGNPVNFTAFAAASAAGLVSVDAGRVVFRHPLVGSGVLQQETVARRQAAHRALAEVLTGDTYRRTWHRAQSIVGPDDEVADALEATVADSLRRGAVMSAVFALERAAQLTGSSARRGRRLVTAAQHAFEVGRADVVARLVQDALHTDLAGVDRARTALLTEALSADVAADPARVISLCDNAQVAADGGDQSLALGLLMSAALRCWWADNGLSARMRLATVLNGLSTEPDDPGYLIALAISEPVAHAGDVLVRLQQLDLAAVSDGDVLRTFGMAAYGAGDLPLATDLLDRADHIFQEQGRLGLLPVVLALQFQIRMELGDWPGSASASEEVTRISVETGQNLYAFNNVLVEARSLGLRGEWEMALSSMAEAESDAARLGINDAICLSYQARGAALLSAGRAAEAFSCLVRQYDPSDPGYHLRESFAGLSLMAEAAVDCGRLDEARQIVARMESVAVVTPAPLLHVNLLYARAVLAEPGEAERAYQAACAQDLTRWPWIAARINLEYGRLLLRRGRLAEASDHSRQALAVLARIGANRWVQRAEAVIADAENRTCGDGHPAAETEG